MILVVSLGLDFILHREWCYWAVSIIPSVVRACVGFSHWMLVEFGFRMTLNESPAEYARITRESKSILDLITRAVTQTSVTINQGLPFP